MMKLALAEKKKIEVGRVEMMKLALAEKKNAT